LAKFYQILQDVDFFQWSGCPKHRTKAVSKIILQTAYLLCPLRNFDYASEKNFNRSTINLSKVHIIHWKDFKKQNKAFTLFSTIIELFEVLNIYIFFAYLINV
jgi:hypothetical protein